MLKLLPVTALDQSFEALYAIYVESISPREQKSKADLAAMMSKPSYRLLLAQNNSHAIGFSIVFVASGKSFGLLEYVAVDKSYRGGGLGSELFEATIGAMYRQHGAIPILIEVDSDRQPSPDQAERYRRQNFYRKLGCRRIVGCTYLLPLPGETEPPAMDLLVYVPEPAPTIRGADLQQWLQLVYQEVYGCSADDGRIAVMLKGVSDPVELA
ncbi:MAG: GNAT family N-acetyltransferase [Candidatus Binatia bacterium]